MSANNNSSKAKISSAVATGQSGGFFEQHVGATWLSLLLVRAIPPLLLDTQVVSVAFQTARMGWATDDILVSAETGARKIRKLACQVKRSFTVSSSNDDCRKTFRAFWIDFNSEHFDQLSDRLSLITLRGSNNLLNHLATLFECASIARSSAEFEARLAIDGLVNSNVKKYAEEIRKGLEEDSLTVSDDAFWRFLCTLSVISFDLNTSTAQTEAWIKTLLAHTANGVDKVGSSKATWDALLTLVGNAMPGAREFSRDDLPENIKNDHSSIPSKDHQSIMSLKSHSSTILSGVHGEIGGEVVLRRTPLISSSIEKIVENRIIVLSGPAGNGKSAVAKIILEQLDEQYFSFVFRSEEFACSHLDETLHKSGLGISGEGLSALLAGQRKKIILIESVERLLEASVRDSFSDLLRLIEKDNSWKLVVTCRSYSIDLVVASFFGQMGLPYSIIDVPPLSDNELIEVESAIPKLARPLANQKLRKLLRNPYVLDKAARMPWPEDEGLPDNEREFRRSFWKGIVREDDRGNEALPRRREQVLTEVALRRAKALSLYAKCDDLDQIALRKLHQIDLIAISKDTDTLAAPAHDLLEDWALLSWLEIQAAQEENNPQKVADAIGTYPALRRAYRLWLTEKCELDPDVADSFIYSVIKDQSLASHFRDDTIVSILKGDSGAGFLTRNRTALLANEAELLKRVIHLLRVACKAVPDWLASVGYMDSSLMAPIGSAWPQALALVRESLPSFVAKDAQLALGLIEDWSRLVSMDNPFPEGQTDAAAIAFELLEIFGGYRYDDARKRLFSIVSKIPRGDREAFLGWMSLVEQDDRDAEEFAGFLLEGSESAYCAKDFPDELIQLCKSYLYFQEPEGRGTFSRFRRMDVDEFFGFDSHREFYPPSALRGPFLPLLQHHFKKGIEFIIEFVNYAADCYANPKGQDRLESPWEVSLVFADGSGTKQWHSERLWQLYRGASVGPYAVMCALMALEHILLGFAKNDSDHLDSWLSYIIKKSNNSALSAVVSSIVVAYPNKYKETAKILLRCRDYVEIDLHMAAIDRGVSTIQAMFPSVNAGSQLYVKERKEADSLEHRSRHLELIALDLQLTNIRGEIQEIIDEHHKSLPNKDQQDNADKIWRLSLHRMDLRKYSAKETTRKELAELRGQTDLSGGDPEESIGVILQSEAPEADISEVIERERPRIDSNHNLVSLLNWSWSCFIRDSKADSSRWSEYLQRAMATEITSKGDMGLSWESAPALVAAVCVRDHWTELSGEQKTWCLEAMGSVIASNRDSDDEQVIISHHAMSADRPCALSISAVISIELDSEYGKIATRILTDALFHACEEVSTYAAGGIGQFLWDKPDNVLQFVRALVYQAVELDRLYELERQKNYGKRRDFYDLYRQVNINTRKRVIDSDSFEDISLSQLDFDKPHGGEVLKKLLQIFKDKTVGSVGQDFFGSLVRQLCKWWQAKDSDERVPYELVHVCQGKLAEYVLGLEPKGALDLCQPLLALVDVKPKEVGGFLKDLLSSEDDSHKGKETFWALWDAFALKIKGASWANSLNSDYFSGEEILRSVFLGLHWKKGTRRWEPLKGYEDHVVLLFRDLPASFRVLNQMAIFLYYVGDMTLPGAFVQVAEKLKEAPSILSESNTIFCLEQVLQRHVYGSPQKLKTKKDIREAVICILDELVEKGSSAAFKMRDDFVTPMKES